MKKVMRRIKSTIAFLLCFVMVANSSVHIGHAAYAMDIQLTLNSNGSITSTWEPVDGAVRYGVIIVDSRSTVYYRYDNLTGTTHTSIANLTDNQTYYVSVSAYDSTGYSPAYATKTMLVPLGFYDNVPLDVPEDVAASATAASVTISWDTVSRATGYDVLFNGKVYGVSGASSTSWNITGLSPKTSYTYQVRAKNSKLTGAYSAARTITTQATPLSTPGGVSATATSSSATVSWSAVSGATGYDLRFGSTTYSVTGTSRTMTGLTPGTDYTYSIRAKNADTTSSYSTAKTISTLPTAPTTPSGIAATATHNSVTVSWSAVSGAAGYDVKFNGTEYDVTGTSKVFAGLSPKTAYSYSVRAKNAGGTSSYSSQKSITTSAAPLSVPANVTAIPATNSVTVSWTAVTGATSYDVRLGDSSYNVTATSRTFTGLTANKAYTYTVRAKNADTASDYSTSQTVTTLPGPPSLPGGIAATVTADSVTVSWNTVTGATGYEVLFDGTAYSVTATSRTFTGLTSSTSYTYQVRAVNAGGTSSYSSSRSITTLKAPPPVPANVTATATSSSATVSWDASPGATSYELIFNGSTSTVYGTSRSFAGLSPQTGYTYQVRARNTAGTSAYSAAKTVTTLPQSPAVPANVKATATKNSITVSWDAVSGATGYDVKFDDTEYSVTGTTKTFTGLTPGSRHSYAVRAKNAGGASIYSTGYYVTTIPDPPSVPTSVTATAKAQSVTVSWSRADGAASYEVLFGGTIYSVTGTSRTITGLNPETGYSYRVRAVNAGGTSSYSAIQNITTRPLPPLPDDIGASADRDSVTVSWSPVEGAETYDIIFDGETHTTEDTSITFTGLTPDTDYTYQVRTNHADGQSTLSPEQTVRLASGLPEAPADVTAVTTDDSVTVSWSPAADAGSYEVTCNGNTTETTDTSAVFTGFQPDTEYSYSVRAKNDRGVSPSSPVKKVRTAPAPPTAPRTERTPDSITVSWDPITGALSYDIEFGDQVYRVTVPSKTFEGLAANTDYTYRIRVNNKDGSSAYSPWKTVRTGSNLPGVPQDVRAVSSFDTVTISWRNDSQATEYDAVLIGGGTALLSGGDDMTYPSLFRSGTMLGTGLKAGQATTDGTGIAAMWAGQTPADGTGIDVYVSALSRPSEAVTVTSTSGGRTSTTFYNLEPDTDYEYEVRAGNQYGFSDYSPRETIRTKPSQQTGLSQAGAGKTYQDGTASHLGLDPVNPLTGAFVWSYTFLEDYGQDILHFTTMYDSRRDSLPRPLGRKWSHCFDYLLTVDGNRAYFATPYGEVAPFDIDLEHDLFQPAEGYDMGYVLSRKNGTSLSVTAPDGTEYVFKNGEYLEHIIENGLVSYQFRADSEGRIVSIAGRHGGILDFGYTGDRITSVTDTLGRRVYLTYVGDADLVSVSDPLGHSVAFTYDQAGHLLTVSDFAGDVGVTNYYDSQGRVTRQDTAGRGTAYVSYEDLDESEQSDQSVTFTDELGVDTRYTYNEALQVTAVETAGSSIQNRYNDDGQLISQTDALGNVTSLVYDEEGRITAVTYPDGTTEEIIYNTRNLPVRIVNRDGTEVRYGYDVRNNLTSLTDERGYTEYFTYDSDDNLLTHTDKKGAVSHYSYDSSGHLFAYTDAEGNLYRYLHNAAGRLTAFSAPSGSTTSYRYSAAGDLTAVSDLDGSISYAYNENGSPVLITDKLGYEQRLAYDAAGRVSLVTDLAGNEYRYAYDARGALITETDAAGGEISYAYDDLGNLISETDANGNTTEYGYDAAGQLLTITDALGNLTAYAYDSMGRTISVTDPLSHQTRFAYDSMGRTTSVTDAAGHSTAYTYDEAGNLKSETDAAGAVTSYDYDEAGHLTAVTDEAGTLSLSYDSLGRVTSIRDKDGRRETYGYDEDGNLTCVTDKENRQTLYTYDSLGHLTGETDAAGHTTRYEYDAAGNCTSVTDAAGNEYRFTYDANGLVTQETDPLGHVTAYGYDALGRLIAVTDPRGHTAVMEYDAAGNLVSETDALGGERSYTYDALSRLTAMRDEEGFTQSLSYDAAGSLASYTDAAGHRWDYEYDALGRPTVSRGEDGSSYTMEYGPTGLLAAITDQEGARTAYAYDSLGRLTAVTDALGNSTGYTYDALGNVTSLTDARENVIEYEYSPAGNLLKVTAPGGHATEYTYDARDLLLTAADPRGAETAYAYDALGQLTSVTAPDGGVTAFTYTAAGQTASMTGPDGRSEVDETIYPYASFWHVDTTAFSKETFYAQKSWKQIFKAKASNITTEITYCNITTD